MLNLTENASTVVKGIADQIPEASGLRITALATEEAQPPSFDVAPAAQAEPGDEVVEADGATVYLDGDAAQELDDKVLDASVDQEGRVEFALAPQG
jgi:Fe-S cluster assembly iron-binding protein IscA